MMKRKPKKLNAKQRELRDSWESILKKYPSKNVKPMALKEPPVFRRETPHIPSKIETGYSCCAKPADKVYTGDKMLGIGTLHKSNAVPVFSTDEAVEISKMRRG